MIRSRQPTAPFPPGLLPAAALAALMICVLVSAGLGYMPVAVKDVARSILSLILGQGVPQGLDPAAYAVVTQVRLPRIFTAAWVGGSLAVSGAVFQGILRNPLADPYTLGVSAGAGFGASLALLLGISLCGVWSVSLFAFAGALASLFVVMRLASGAGYSSGNLVLAGIIVAAILSAGISFLKYVADERVSVIIFWLMGSFASKTWTEAGLTLGAGLAGSAFCLAYARDLNCMALGERGASSLGVDTSRITALLLAAASLMAAVCVAVSGIIGFVGLLVPHILRPLTGPDNRRLIPACFLVGAVLLLSADTLTRAVLPNEIPIGVLTALLGGPFFCWIFSRRMTKGAGAGL
ncbi:MAG: iron ABC transporter permease [Thermodesulfobacteriota bacterium]